MLQQVAALSAKEGRDGGPSSKQGLRAKGSNDDGASRRYQPLEPTRSNSTSAWSSEGIIVPDGTWKENWDIWILVLILYSAAIVPYRVCFDVEAEGLLWVFEAAMSIFFLIDVVLSFRTAYFVDGVWVTDPQMIANRYLKGWFWIDAPSSLPLEILALFETLGDNSQLSLLRFLRLMRLLRLLKLLKIDQYLDMMEEVLEMNLRFVQLIIMLAKVGFLSHILGCFWYGVGANSRGPDGDGATWYTSYGGDEEATVGQLYMWSIYWAVMTLTTTGYGDVVPTNDNERLYVLMALIVGALVFGYMISNLSAVINSLDRQVCAWHARTCTPCMYAHVHPSCVWHVHPARPAGGGVGGEAGRREAVRDVAAAAAPPRRPPQAPLQVPVRAGRRAALQRDGSAQRLPARAALRPDRVGARRDAGQGARPPRGQAHAARVCTACARGGSSCACGTRGGSSWVLGMRAWHARRCTPSARTAALSTTSTRRRSSRTSSPSPSPSATTSSKRASSRRSSSSSSRCVLDDSLMAP